MADNNESDNEGDADSNKRENSHYNDDTNWIKQEQ